MSILKVDAIQTTSGQGMYLSKAWASYEQVGGHSFQRSFGFSTISSSA